MSMESRNYELTKHHSRCAEKIKRGKVEEGIDIPANWIRIRGYIGKGEFIVNLGCQYGPQLLVILFIQHEGKL